MLRFVTPARKEGWLSIICNNHDTVKWLKMVNTTKPWKEDTRLASGDEVPKAQIRIASVQVEDSTAEENFFERLNRQSLGINTSKLCVFMVDTDKHGGKTFTFTADDA